MKTFCLSLVALGVLFVTTGCSEGLSEIETNVLGDSPKELFEKE